MNKKQSLLKRLNIEEDGKAGTTKKSSKLTVVELQYIFENKIIVFV